MFRLSFRALGSITGGLLLLVSVAAPALAVDGVIEINQARALAGGVTPGDTPGFPVTISQPGSYRLTGNLTIEAVSINGILVNADNVTIDLNGFTIAGPTVCSYIAFVSCSPYNDSFGIGSYRRGISVINGSIRGMGTGISLGTSGRVEKVNASSNSVYGITTQSGSVLTSNTVSYNGNTGISAFGTISGNTIYNNGNGNGYGIYSHASTVTGNTVTDNIGIGIQNTLGLVMGNTVLGNSFYGLYMSGGGGYGNNVFNNNNMGGDQVYSYRAVQIGTNACINALCP